MLIPLFVGGGGRGWIVLDPCFVMQCFFSSSGIISAKKR